MKHRVRQVGRRAHQLGRQRIGDAGIQMRDPHRLVVAGEREQHALDILASRRLVEREPDRRRVHTAEVHAMRNRSVEDAVGVLAGRHEEGVEVSARRHAESETLEAVLQDAGEPVGPAGDRREPLGAVVDGVHGRDHREQHLRSADVRRGLLAADVLLARLQREPERRIAVRIDGHADEPSRHRALEFVARREVAGVRPAVAHRHAEALGRADDDVGTPFARAQTAA